MVVKDVSSDYTYRDRGYPYPYALFEVTKTRWSERAGSGNLVIANTVTEYSVEFLFPGMEIYYSVPHV